jgi:hypothetical protein
LQNEYESLKKINKSISTNLIAYGKIKIGDNISYLITTYENAESIFEVGKSFLIENFDSFCFSYAGLQTSKRLKRYIDSYLNDMNEMIDIKSYFLEDSLASMKAYTDLDRILKILSKFKEEINEKYKLIPKNKQYICHGNFNYNNIITRNGLFKFINFEKSIQSHCFLDFSNLVIELGINYETESQLFKTFCINMDIEYNEESLNKYKQYYEFCLRCKIVEILISYLKEVYLYKSLRVGKIIKLCDRFSQAYERFATIEFLNEHHEFIISTLTEPIFGIKHE